MSQVTRTWWIDHPLKGRLVTDPETGRVGRMDGALQHIDRETNRVVYIEAHMRPVDGSGREWTANANDLVVADAEA